MDIKVGNYVRCGTSGIRRVNDVVKTPKDFSIKHIIDDTGLFIGIQYIYKVSKNKIGIVEQGDYVNGKEVKLVTEKRVYFDEYYDNLMECWQEYSITEEQILDILTKEQFHSKKYVFKEELEYGQE